MHLTVKSTKKMAFSSHQSEKKAELVSRLSTILRKKTAEQVRLPIRMALSPPKSCSVDKWKYILLPSNHKLPWKAFAFRGSLCFTSMQLVLLQSVFQLAVERFGLYMLLQGLGRIYTAQRAVEPLSLYGGVGGESSTGRCHSVVSRLRSAGQ